MKQTIRAAAAALAALFLASCKTTDAVPEPPKVDEPTAPAVEEPAPEIQIEEETPPELTKEESEFLRSKGDVQDVTPDMFDENKRDVMDAIEKLARIMRNSDYNGWLRYVDQESKDYYTKAVNLNKVSKRLPQGRKMLLPKGRLTGLKDYFMNVFIPARIDHEVDEIRYISKDYVKAVQVREDADVVYYYFNKIDGKWLVHLPPVED